MRLSSSSRGSLLYAVAGSEMDPSRLARVVVVGTSGSGKTTLARSLSSALKVPHVELDALHWGPSWTPRPFEEFRSRVQTAISTPAWVIDGNYSRVRALIWRRATTLVWLNYSFARVYSRAVSRTLRRALTQEELYSGNRESLRQVIEPDWILWWVLRTFWRRRREYPALLQEPGFAHLQILELTQPRQSERFLAECAASSIRS
jgi:adenylate kinase family enzyme